MHTFSNLYACTKIDLTSVNKQKLFLLHPMKSIELIPRGCITCHHAHIYITCFALGHGCGLQYVLFFIIIIIIHKITWPR